MEFDLKPEKRCNRITIGDRHDLSIEHYIKTTNFPFYIIRPDGEYFWICGAEEIVPVEKTVAEEPKPQKSKKGK